MRRLLCMVLTGAVMIGCLCTGTGAVDESNVVSYSFETTGTAITRATGNLDWTIEANGTVFADTSCRLVKRYGFARTILRKMPAWTSD